MKEYLLHIDTATTNCSVAVSLAGELLYCKESNAPDFRHSDYLHLFIEAALKEAGVAIQSLAGVGVSMGQAHIQVFELAFLLPKAFVMLIQFH